MKKNYFISALCFCIMFSNCGMVNFSKEDEDTIASPEVGAVSEGIRITPKDIAYCQYISIFRCPYDDSSDPKYDTKMNVNVAQLIPEEGKELFPCTFIDKNVNNGSDYVYIIKYKTLSGAKYSDVSQAVRAASTGTAEKVFLDQSTPINAVFNTEDKRITFEKTEVTETFFNFNVDASSVQGEYEPYIIIDNGSKTVLFKMDSEANLIYKYLEALPPSFKNVELEIYGLVGQVQSEFEEEKDRYKIYVRSDFKNFEISDQDGDPIEDPIIIKETDPDAEKFEYFL